MSTQSETRGSEPSPALTSFGSEASTDHAATLSGNSVMREDMPHQRGNTAGFKSSEPSQGVNRFAQR